MPGSVPQGERQRKLQSLTFAESSILSRDLPKDTCLKSLIFRLSGSVTTTFASGTPVADAQSTFDNIIPRIDVIVNGSRTVKSVRPHLMHMQQLLSTQVQAERAASAGASAATDNFPTADGGFTYGTTGQLTSARESVLVSFQNVWCKAGYGAETTWLNLKGVASAEAKLTTAAFSKLLGFGNTAPVVYSASTMIVDILTNEQQDVHPGAFFSDWKQTTKEVTFSAQVTNNLVDINRGNSLQGIMMFTRDGAAGSTTTATGKLAGNLVVTDLSVLLNGQYLVKATDFKSLQAENRLRYGVNAPYASNVSRLDGIAYLNFLTAGDIRTALDVRPPAVDNLQLSLSTNTSSNVSYTNPVSVTIMTDEIVSPRA